MNRRDTTLALLTLGAASGPLATFAQQQRKVWRIGFLMQRGRPASLDTGIFGAFLRSMRELGYVEGKNLLIEWRFADGKYESLPDHAADLVRQKVDVIVTDGTPGTLAAQKATMTIPIVMGGAGDPVGDGLVKSLARPGGNTTGLSNLAGDLGSKHLEMLLDLNPRLSHVAVLMNPGNSSHGTILKNVQGAALKPRIRILPVEARSSQEFESAFSVMTREHAEAVIVIPDPFFIQQWRQIAELAAKHRLPSVTRFREYSEAGGLMSYGNNNADNYRRAASYVDKILKGTKPANLPVEQPTKFDLVVNMKTAKTLGITIPQSLLLRADEVIK